MKDEILNDLSAPALERAIKYNLFEFCRAAAQLPQGDFKEDEFFTRWTFRVPYPWYNAVLAKRAGNVNDAKLIKETVDYFQSLQIGPFVWWLDPAISHADWDTLLSPQGYIHSSGPPGMAADLTSMNTNIPTPKGFEIITVEDEETLNTWVEVFLKGYGLPSAFRDGIYTLLRDFGFDQPSRNYLGLLDGKAVCTSNVFFGAGVAGIQMVATLPEARGKGGGAAVTLKPLLDARQMGYRVGTLQSSEMGYNVYKRLGFEHVCQMENYYHP